MLGDVVVDTNVLLHADDPREARQGDAITFINGLLACETLLCVDEGFDLSPGANRSLVGAEYLEKLIPMSLGYQLVVGMVRDGRLRLVGRSVDQAARRTINRVVPNRRDRTFARVAYNSDEQVLCSHDFRDFSRSARDELLRRLGVRVCEAGLAAGML